jgi:hypothetical protein
MRIWAYKLVSKFDNTLSSRWRTVKKKLYRIHNTSCPYMETPDSQCYTPNTASKAFRDIRTWKLEVSNYVHPLSDYSYFQYMKSKQTINWEFRRWDNRQWGLWEDSLFESLCRHIETIKLLKKWYHVYEVKKDWVCDILVYTQEKDIIGYDFVEKKNMIDELNACRFNSEWLKLYKLWHYDKK